MKGALQDPTLELTDSSGRVISNGNWRATRNAETIATTCRRRTIVKPASCKRSYQVLTRLSLRGKDDPVAVVLVEGYTLQ